MNTTAYRAIGLKVRIGKYRFRVWPRGFEISTYTRGRIYPFPWSSLFWRHYALLILLALPACVGTPETRTLNAVNVACNTYDAALVDMTALLNARRLTLAQAERFDLIRRVASPICFNAPSATPDMLRTLETELIKLGTLRQEVK